MWDADSGDLLKTAEIDAQLCAAFSRDTKFVLVGDAGGNVAVYNVETGTKVTGWATTQKLPIHAVAISLNGRFALTGSRDGKLHYWGLPSAVAALLDLQSSGLSPDEYQRLSALIDQARKEGR